MKVGDIIAIATTGTPMVQYWYCVNICFDILTFNVCHISDDGTPFLITDHEVSISDISPLLKEYLIADPKEISRIKLAYFI